MATYAELFDLFNGESGLKNKISVACTIKAADIVTKIIEDIANETTLVTVAEKAWAVSVFENPQGMAEKVMKFLVADNNALTIEQITGASDSAIQTKVDASLALFGG